MRADTGRGNMGKYIIALDQGTTSSRCILFDREGKICSVAQKEFTQIYPQPGWVEHDPMEIWSSQLAVAMEAMGKIGAHYSDISAIGITNQRETTIVWDKETGEPVYNAIVWQCRRTADQIEQLKKAGWGEKIRERTGLIPDAYFSGSKISWILDHVEGCLLYTSGIDISVGSVMALAGVMTAKNMTSVGIIPALILACAAAVVVGCVNGFCVGKLRLQAMVITLGMQLAVRGAAQVLCGGRDIYFNRLGKVGEELALWGSYKIGGVVPIQLVPIIISVIFVWILADKTVLGRQIQAVGDSIKSSSLAGINAARTLMIVYGLSAFLAAFAGLFQAARVTVAAGSSLGQLAELDAIAACLLYTSRCV